MTCHAISSDWCHNRCQEESIDSAGFSIFNGVNGHLLSSDGTAALFQMEAHVTPRLIMPATSREARAQCPWLLTKSKVRQQRPRCSKHSIIFIISLITFGIPRARERATVFQRVWGIIVISSLGIVRIPIGCLFWSTELANAKPNWPAKPYLWHFAPVLAIQSVTWSAHQHKQATS